MPETTKIHNPTCAHCTALPMPTATQIIPGPGGVMFANVFCAACGCSVGVCYIGLAQPEQARIVKPS